MVHETTFTDGRGEYHFRNVAAGTYQISVALTGFSTVTRDNIVVGAGEATAPSITLELASIGETIVVSASKTDTTLVNSPVTMSVLPGSTLETTAAQNYGDVLRTVPGVNVIQLSARDVNITSRQATGTLANSQLALLDGRSIYLDFFGLVLWDFVPSNPSDIKQIEVVRGPASSIWGANALTGVVNIITKTPREAPGTVLTLSGGMVDRDAGSTVGKGAGGMFGAGVSTSQILNDKWSYRVSAGYFSSDAFPRPTGQIPRIQDPRDPTGATFVGGATYPADAAGAFGTAFQNTGTHQPKFDARIDQELEGAHITYAGGVAGTQGTVYTGIGPFDIQPGSVMSYGKMNYSRGALKFNVFGNFVNAEAPNLLLPDPATGKALQLNFSTQTFDVEIGHAKVVGRNSFTYGGNFRRNNFDITLAPNAENRNEIGAYLNDDISLNQFRFSVGGRVDKFGNIEDPVFSPRLTAIYQPTQDHSLRVSFNKAFRAPSVVNNYLDVAIVQPVPLTALGLPQPFPLLVHAVGSKLPIGTTAQKPLVSDSVTAYEFAYTGTINRRTQVGAAFYINNVNDEVNFSQLPFNLDPYTAANPPPGWPLPPAVLTLLASQGVYLPRTGFTYLNLGPLRQKGIELSVDQRFTNTITGYANYSWQAEPEILDDPNPYPRIELALPPTNRFNIGGAYNGGRFLGNLSVSYSDKAFWSDVLGSTYHGYTGAYTLVNGTFGVKWADGTITTSVKSTNILNRTIQQHVFGDLLRRTVLGEVRFAF
jgi:iron complex outermembrane receptor protein